MIRTFLSDEVINSTELRDHQKLWLERASVSPVSIKSGSKRLVLLNREHARKLYLLNHYAQMVIRFCREQQSEQDRQSTVFPWIERLSKEALAEFHRELLSTFDDVIHGGSILALEEMLDAWSATAEALTNPEVVELLSTDLASEEFTAVE